MQFVFVIQSAVEDEKQRRREAKMQATRQAAIDKLRKKREEKRKENERIVKEEMVRKKVVLKTIDLMSY